MPNTAFSTCMAPLFKAPHRKPRAVFDFRSVVGIDCGSVETDAVAVETAWVDEVGNFGFLVDDTVIVEVVGHTTFSTLGITVCGDGKPSVGSVADGAGKVVAERFPMVVCAHDESPQPKSEVLAQCVRTAFIPAEGMKFIVADFSSIEARVLAWLGGEQWKIEAFREGKDIYCETDSRMFHVKVEKHG